MDLALHAPRRSFFLEKWYVDVLLDDGGVLLVYLASMRLFGARIARVTAELFAPGAEPFRGSAKARRLAGGPDRLEFGPARIDGDRLTWQTAGLSGELTIVPRHEPFELRDPFLATGSGTLHWLVEVPDADATGRLWWPGGERPVAGRSYRDRVWFDIAPWRFPIRELHWGRAFAGSHAATWVRALTADGEVRSAWLDGRVREGLDDSVRVEEGRPFVESAVVDLPGLLLGPVRPVLRRLTRDPHEVKYAAPATTDGERGRALYEVVRWR